MLKGSVTESIVSSVGAEFLTQYFIISMYKHTTEKTVMSNMLIPI